MQEIMKGDKLLSLFKKNAKVYTEKELNDIANKFYILGALDFDNFKSGDGNTFKGRWKEFINEL